VVRQVRVAGLGGSLRAASTSLSALKAALEGAAAAGAEVQLISVRDLGLPLYTTEHATPAGAARAAGVAVVRPGRAAGRRGRRRAAEGPGWRAKMRR
jgi:NADPH-dependent FMN reductase